jgi:drug/metabolite transporter (DMT)-like permease
MVIRRIKLAKVNLLTAMNLMNSKNGQHLTLPSREIVIAFIAFVIFTGSAPVAMKIAYLETPPFWTGLIRFGCGAMIYWMLVIIKRDKIPKDRALLGAILYGVFGLGCSFALVAWGLSKTSASISSIIQALVPLMTVLLSAIQGLERLTVWGVAGSVLAVIGTMLTVSGAPSTDISLPHILALILASVFMAQSSIILKRFPSNPPVVTNAIAISIASIILAALSIATGEQWVFPSQTGTWIAIVYLIIFVTIFAFLLYLHVLDNWTVSGTSYSFVLIPLATFVFAVFLSQEKITLNFLIGAAIVLAGVLVGALLPGRNEP